MVQLFEVRRLIARQHVRLPLPIAQVVVLRAHGYPIGAMQRLLHRSRSAIYRDLERACDVILLPVGLSADPYLLDAWAWAHAECCLEARVKGA